jgi:hypothetical protein
VSSYITIASQTLSSATATVTFSSIPTTLNGKTIRDLVLVTRPLMTSNASPRIRFNSDTGNNYFYVIMQGNGSTTFTVASQDNSFMGLSDGAASRLTQLLVMQIFDYTTTKQKTILMRDDSATERTVTWAGRWANTASIDTISLTASAGSFDVGSTFTLYGIEG